MAGMAILLVFNMRFRKLRSQFERHLHTLNISKGARSLQQAAAYVFLAVSGSPFEGHSLLRIYSGVL